MGLSAVGISDTLYSFILKFDVDLRKDLFANIVLSGDTRMFPGFADRLLLKEITGLAPINTKINFNIIAPPDRKYSTLISGCILASLPTLHSKWISEEEYDESGADIIDLRDLLDRVCRP